MELARAALQGSQQLPPHLVWLPSTRRGVTLPPVAPRNLEPALDWLREQRARVEEELAQLVSINSYTENREGGLRVGERLKELFTIPGLSMEVIPSSSGKFADHLLFSTGASGAPIALVGHLDTVFPPGQFEGFRRDGSLARGPGVLDMKGGLVVVALALRALAQEGMLSSIPLHVVIVADEEVGSPEGKEILRQRVPRARAALVFEAGRAGDAIITRRKGTGGLTVRAKGKAAHAGNLHHEGINAIWALAVFIDRAQRLTRYDEGITVNVGKISGGQGKNTVPDAAEALVDFRFTSMASGARLLQAVHAAAREAEQQVPGSTVEVQGGVLREPLERSASSEQLRDLYASCATLEGLGASEAPLLGGGSDANTTSALGIASIDGLGPRGKGFHTLDEQIELATLIPKAAALLRYLLQAHSSP